MSLLMCFSELPGSYLSLSHSSVTGRFPPALLQQRLLYPATYSPSCHHLSRLKGEGVKGCWKYILWAMSFLSAMLLKPNLLSVPLGRSEKLSQVGATTEEKEGALLSGTERERGREAQAHLPYGQAQTHHAHFHLPCPHPQTNSDQKCWSILREGRCAVPSHSSCSSLC